MDIKVTAVILTKDEEKNIESCLGALQWCDEVIIIDDNSTDKTVQLAKKQGAIIYTHSLDNDFSQQRNYGLEKATNQWVVFVDADERVPTLLQEEITNAITNPLNIYNGFSIKRVDVLWNKQLHHGEIANIKLTRVGRKDTGLWSGKVHEIWNIKGESKVLKNSLLHYPHQSVTEFLKEINFYTTLRARELYDQKIRSSFFTIIIYTKGKFFINYFLKLGFLDGIPGLIHAILMSFHSFLVRSKLWLLWEKK